MQSSRVLLLQPMADDGPAYLATWLSEAGVPFEVCSVAAGDTVPTSAEPFDAIAMLGGSMSVNDDLPFLRRAEQLIGDAVLRGRPVLGHCLGGQMLAKVLGARTTDNPVPEFGWSEVKTADEVLAGAWLGEQGGQAFPAYQWHFQTFGLPPGATLLASSDVCAHQAFAWGPHLAMQFHIEVDAEKLNRWAAEAPPDGDPLRAHASVQGEAAMRAGTERWLARSQRVAAHVYARWLALAGWRGSPLRPPARPPAA